jgi:hypothetical protein
MGDHNMLAGVLAVGTGSFSCFWLIFVIAAVVIYLVRAAKAAQKERQVAIDYSHSRSAGTVGHSLQERHEACARLAAKCLMEFHPDDPWNLPAKYNDFELFTLGHSRRASNVAAGDIEGRPVILCDYQYLTGSGVDELTSAFQVALLELPITAPRLEMHRENDFGRSASWDNHEDLSLANEKFARRYHVRSDDPKFAHQVLTADLQAYLAGCGLAPNVIMHGPVMILTVDGRGDAARFPELLTVGVHLIGSLSPQVLAERGTDTSEDAHGTT